MTIKTPVPKGYFGTGVLRSQILFDPGDGILLQAGHLGLTDADLGGDLHLGPALAEAQGEDVLFPWSQPGDGLVQGNLLQPALVGVLLVGDLVHHIDRVPGGVVHRLEETHGLGDGVQGHDHVLPANLQRLGNLLHRGLRLLLGDEGLPGLQDPVGRVPHAAGYPHGAVVPQITADFTDDHWNAVGGKADVLPRVKVVDGLDEADAAYLKQIVEALAPAGTPGGKALDYGEHQAKIPLNQAAASLPVARLCAPEQSVCLLRREGEQTGCVYPADLDLSQHLRLSSRGISPQKLVLPGIPHFITGS